jgi:hypothetical protein
MRGKPLCLSLRCVGTCRAVGQLDQRDGVVLGNMLNYTTTVKRRHRIVSNVQIDFCKGCV